eukprot:TRINITY_DN556_c0_g1_i4.p1 TRINITY_DN556_c0_g1~~TRINITY_DN556_c0_g1_i4.p1  ORF type:complete len:244 (-),score=25.29 TRINITY_DN556_c0_g1_i4:177-908(-)
MADYYLCAPSMITRSLLKKLSDSQDTDNWDIQESMLRLRKKSFKTEKKQKTILPIQRLPDIYDRIMFSLNDPNEYNRTEIQNLLMNKISDNETNNHILTGDPESNLISFVKNEIYRDIKNRQTYKRNGVVDPSNWTTSESEKKVLDMYNNYINSDENQKKLSYRTDSSTRYVWTEDDINKFHEAYRTYGNGPKSNKQIAQTIGKGVHPNHVAHFKQYLRKKKRLERKKMEASPLTSPEADSDC